MAMRPISPMMASGHEILTTAECAAADAAAEAAGIPLDRLMRRAGEAVADSAAEIARPGGAIAVLCGPGNNGGDGYVAARVLAARGFAVSVYAARSPAPDGPAGRAAAAWIAGAGEGAIRPVAAFQPAANVVVVDALYGAGLARPIVGEEAGALARCAASGSAMVAVDLPSGLDGDTGHPTGPCLKARRTVTFFRLKPAHVLWPGRGLCGEVVCADIGLLPAHAPASAEGAWVNGPALWRGHIPEASPDAHKYARGHCLVVSGGEFRTGASRLAAQGALRAGCGAVTIAGEAAALRIHAAHVSAIMLHPVNNAGGISAWIAERRPAAAVFGPAGGLDGDARARLDVLLDAPVPLVLDADALTLLAGRKTASRTAPLVLTPHGGEFARLFPDLTIEPGFAALPASGRLSKIEQARAAARLSNAIVVFKGTDTVVAAPDGRAAVNTNAGPELATAGSGDVLAGIIGAHLAQGMPAFEAAASGVWLHAQAGRAFGIGLTADDLAAGIRPLTRVLGSGGAQA